MSHHRAALGLCAALAATSARGADIDTQVTTLAGLRPLAAGGTSVTSASVVESLSFRLKDLQTPVADDVRVLLSGWGAFGNWPKPEAALTGDLDLAYIEARFFKRHLKVRLGRQSVMGGVSRVGWLDGLSVEAAAPLGLSAQLAMGVPVTPRFGKTLSGQWQLNARLQWAPNPYRWSLAASFIRMDDHGVAARQEVGLDGRVNLLGALTLAGAAMFNTVDLRFSEIDLGPRWQPSDSFELGAGYRRTAPDLLIPRTSIFSVFSDTSRDEAFANVFWAPQRWLTLYADGRGLFIDGENGADVSVRATVRPDRRSPTSLALQGRVLKLPSNGYVEGRLSATHQLLYGLFVSGELDAFVFDKTINAAQYSVTGAGSLAWAFAAQWRITVSVLGATTPTFVSRAEVFARLTYIAGTEGAR